MVLQTIVIIGMSLRFITMLEDVSNNLLALWKEANARPFGRDFGH